MRRHYLFYGSVQGVGFRYRAYHAANSYGVTGYVRNLPDGSVEMEAEGSAEAIDMVIHEISLGRFIQIDRIEKKDIPEQGDSSFRTD